MTIQRVYAVLTIIALAGCGGGSAPPASGAGSEISMGRPAV